MQLKWAYIACDVLASIAGLIDVPVIFERAVIKLAPLAFQTCLISLSESTLCNLKNVWFSRDKKYL